MKRRIILVVTGLLLAAAVWWVVENRPAADSGLVYQGKTVRQWLAEVFTTNQSAAMGAFRQMGTNAFPGIIHELKKNGSLWDEVNRLIYACLPPASKRSWRRPMAQPQIWSAATLVLVNSQAKPELFRELMPILENKHYQSRQNFFSLAILLAGPEDRDCVPALTALLPDPDLNTRCVAAMALWKITGKTNTAVTALGEAMKAPGKFYMKDYAPVYLHEINPQDQSLIPVFIADLGGTDQGLQFNAVMVLESYGPAAKAAVPALTNLAASGRQPARQYAIMALRKIDPKAAENYEGN